MVISLTIDQGGAKQAQLIERIKEYYTYFENKDWGEMYELLYLKLQTTLPDAKSKFIEGMQTKIMYGKVRWGFDSIELKEIIMRDNKAFVEIEYSLTDKWHRKPSPKETWWDEWIFIDGKWMIEHFMSGGRRPDHWPN